jgi:pilus assembly protein CpaF
MAVVREETTLIRERVRGRLLRDPVRWELDRMSPPERRLRVRGEVMAVLREGRTILPAGALNEVINQISDEVVGLGPLERLLKDPEVSEVMVNGADDVYVERKGRIERVDGLLFEGEEQVFHLIERIVAPLGLRVDESSPYVDARLSDGARVNAIIPPLSLCGPVLTIRKFALRPFGPGDLVRLDTLSEPMAEFLGACVKGRANILVSGGTGAGKTSLLGALSSYIPEHERLITIEDAAELRLRQPHVVTLEARPANVEGVGEVTVRTLVRNALRMRPDRIIVGEVRGGEALDMLQAMNTGHEGSMSTAHANSPRDLLSRLETMALMSDVSLPVQHVREQVAGALDLIVHMTRLGTGTRVVSHITAVEGLVGASIALHDLFVWRRGSHVHLPSRAGTPKVLRLVAERDGRFDAGIVGSKRPTMTEALVPLDGSCLSAEIGSESGRDGDGTRPVPQPEGRTSTWSEWPIDARSTGGVAGWPGALRRLGTVLE